MMSMAVPFPTLWLTRDVEIKDWTTFLACLPEQHSNVTETGHFERYVDEIAWRRKIGNVVAKWNKNFFEPRGLHVIPDLPVRAGSKDYPLIWNGKSRRQASEGIRSSVRALLSNQR